MKEKRNLTLGIVVASAALLLSALVIAAAITLHSARAQEAFSESKEDEAAVLSDGDDVPMEEQGITYTEEEFQAEISKLLLDKESERQQALAEGEEGVLLAIKESLSEGNTFLETIRPFYPNELVVASNSRYYFVPIDDTLKKHSYSKDSLAVLESGEYQYMEGEDVVSYKGIDVSSHQGRINWEKVAEDGVSFAFIRAIYRGYGSGKIVEDEQFHNNIRGAAAAGVKAGVYVFSQALDKKEALEEANLVLDLIGPYEIACPVVIDVERVDDSKARMNALTAAERTEVVVTFCERIKEAGYTPMIYYNTEMGSLMLDLKPLEEYDKWFANYSQSLYYPYDYSIWQYSDRGSVAGIKGKVDLNIGLRKIW